MLIGQFGSDDFYYASGSNRPNLCAAADIKTVTQGMEESSCEVVSGTGGIGTTVFYIGGGCMVALAGVFLITKKRMGKKED